MNNLFSTKIPSRRSVIIKVGLCYNICFNLLFLAQIFLVKYINQGEVISMAYYNSSIVYFLGLLGIVFAMYITLFFCIVFDKIYLNGFKFWWLIFALFWSLSFKFFSIITAAIITKHFYLKWILSLGDGCLLTLFCFIYAWFYDFSIKKSLIRQNQIFNKMQQN